MALVIGFIYNTDLCILNPKSICFQILRGKAGAGQCVPCHKRPYYHGGHDGTEPFSLLRRIYLCIYSWLSPDCSASICREVLNQNTVSTMIESVALTASLRSAKLPAAIQVQCGRIGQARHLLLPYIPQSPELESGRPS